MKKPYGLTIRGLLKEKEKILLLKKHLNSKTNPDRWKLPDGKVNPGEDFDKAFIREFKEESALNIELKDLIGAVQENFPHKKTVAIIMNIIIKSGKYNIEISEEHVDWKWATIDEIKNLKVFGWFKRLLEENKYIL
ncbi:ADP-ribose pyrophosphatase [Candidatus Methanobinarius endosymbioticus]|uniref:ADP-ribose pyrophosphatase n=1 Tax=Candidatus Methanobinarius endosymbioticus TaxID=2006182 RepID=A0A366M929_9EURY|nr:ADP-ribose pyrophosphatase [Candidatus Methanobinarius endosymbioticus]